MDRSTGEVKAGGSGVQNKFQLQSDFGASLGFMRFCFSKRKGGGRGEEGERKKNREKSFPKQICSSFVGNNRAGEDGWLCSMASL